MIVQPQRTTFQIWLLAMAALAVATVRGLVIREPDSWALCDPSNGSCDWPSDNVAVQRHGTLDELLAQLDDSPRYRAHIAGQLAAAANSPSAAGYAYAPVHRPDPLLRQQQPPFMSSGWKRQYAGLRRLAAWDGAAALGLARPQHRPFSDNKRARYAFSSWGGKRSPSIEQPAANLQFEGAQLPNKREPAFSNWGGKRSLSIEQPAADLQFEGAQLPNKREPAFSNWGGKRAQKFFNWGGKRSIPDAESTDPTYDGEHAVMKRDVREDAAQSVAAALQSDPSCSKRLCIGETTNLRQLLDEFVEWSRKQPEQKKPYLYSKMLNVRTLHGADNLSAENPTRRAGSFYPWGGKRSGDRKDD